MFQYGPGPILLSRKHQFFYFEWILNQSVLHNACSIMSYVFSETHKRGSLQKQKQRSTLCHFNNTQNEQPKDRNTSRLALRAFWSWLLAESLEGYCVSLQLLLLDLGCQGHHKMRHILLARLLKWSLSEQISLGNYMRCACIAIKELNKKFCQKTATVVSVRHIKTYLIYWKNDQ